MFVAALLLNASLLAQPGRFGTPACAEPDQEGAARSFFLLCHSSAWKVPVWTGYELSPTHLKKHAARPSHFRSDRELRGARAQDSDYRGSGFSRGHLVPAADGAWSEESMRATFLLSNAAPQYQPMNAGPWKAVEARVRKLAADSDALYVFTGPIFEGEVQRIGRGQVAVPTHFYKVVLALRGESKSMFAVIVPNTPLVGSAATFAVTVDEVERRSGLDFFSALEDVEEAVLEAGHFDFRFQLN